MPRSPFRTLLLQSKYVIGVWLLIFLTLLTFRVVLDKPDKEERAIAKRKAEGKVIAPEAYVPVWLYKGLRLNLAIAGVMLLASPWLGRKAAPDLRFMETPVLSRFSRWQYLACARVIGCAAWQNSPGLFHSMWGDEEFNASRFILDYVKHDEVDRDGKPVRQSDGMFKIEKRAWAT